MPLPVSAISQACRVVRDFLDDQLGGDSDKIEVLLDTPAAAAEKMAGDSTGLHWLNLFFHRITPSAFEARGTPGDPWRVRLFCLITAFTNKNPNDGISIGENDLRLLGEVVRLFHENPVLQATDIGGIDVRLEVIFQPISIEDINHLWSTQADVAYRPSVLYEIALAPVVPSKPAIPPMRVAAVGQEVRATMGARQAAFTGAAAVPPVLAGEVDTNNPGWVPRICFLQDGICQQSVVLEMGSPGLGSFAPKVWIAGNPGSPVELAWEVWDSVNGWEDGPNVPGALTAFSSGIDPESPPTGSELAGLPDVSLPFDDHAGQAVLYATRSYRLAGDTRDRVVRSNPLLVTLFEES